MWYGPAFNVDYTITGTIAIRVPDGSNHMRAMRVTIYDYASNKGATQLQLGGYQHQSNEKWYNISASVVSAHVADDRFAEVRFVHDDSASEHYILIGDSSTVWSYPKVFIEDFQGYEGGGSPPEIGFYEDGVNAEPTWDDTRTATTRLTLGGKVVPFISSITSSTSSPTGSPNKGALHLIY